MASPLLALAALASLAAYASACAVPPEGCELSVCESYRGKAMMDQGLNYSLNQTWSGQDIMKLVGVYKGIANKLQGNRPKADTFTKWLNYKNRSPPYPALNYERFVKEAGFSTRFPGTFGLADCCHECRKDEGCVMFRFEPAASAKGASLDTPGKCFKLTGGSYKGDGPFSLTAPHAELGTPFSGTREQQAPAGSNSATALAFVGGFCNPFKQVVDDPHFTGAHGTPYDFNGELGKAFCLVTDRGFHVNAVLKGYRSANTFHASAGADGKAVRSWIREVAFFWAGGHSLRLVARDGKAMERGAGFLASAFLDGQPIEVPSAPGAKVAAGPMSFSFAGAFRKGPYDVESFSVRVAGKADVGFSLRAAHKLLQSADSAQVHFNLVFNELQASEKVHGVLGQTYRDTPAQKAKALKYSQLARLLGEPVKADGQSGQGFLDGRVEDYEASDVSRPDCRVSAFEQ